MRRCPAILRLKGKGCAEGVRCAGGSTGSHAYPHSQLLGRRRREAVAAEEEVEETPQEKKLRLAKLYLEQLRQHGEPCAVPVLRLGLPGR